MKTCLYLAFICMGGFLLGCSTSTYYQGHDGTKGYTDSRLAIDCFHIGFRTTESLSLEDMRYFAFKRAAEVATNHGYRYFIVESEEDLRFKRFSSSKRAVVVAEQREITKIEGYDSYTPGLELSIRCYHESPNENAIDAYRFLTCQFSSDKNLKKRN